MPGRGRKRRQQARRKMNRRERRANKQGGSKISSSIFGDAVGAATAVPRAGLDIVSDAAQRTKQLLTPKG